MYKKDIDELARHFAEAAASNPANNLTMRQVIDSFNIMSAWINEIVLPVLHDISVEMIDAGFYVDGDNRLAFDRTKNSDAYICYRNYMEV